MGFSGILADACLPELLQQFYETHTAIEVEFLTADSEMLEERTIDGRLDFYIGTSKGKSSGMTVIPLIEIGLTRKYFRSRQETVKKPAEKD